MMKFFTARSAAFLVAVPALLLQPEYGYAFTQCNRPVKDIWTEFGTSKVWISFNDAGGSVYKDGNQVSEDQLNRMLSIALSAKVANKRLRIRYPQDGLVCPPSGDRNDIIGIWITD